MSDDQTFERKMLTPAGREARKVFAAAEAKKAISDHEKAQKAFHENRERLKTERLAREAQAKRSATSGFSRVPATDPVVSHGTLTAGTGRVGNGEK
jgi:hypothetical protein